MFSNVYTVLHDVLTDILLLKKFVSVSKILNFHVIVDTMILKVDGWLFMFYHLKVQDQEFPFRMNLARVLIEVEDRNDHVPLFTSAAYVGTVYESAAVGSAVVRVTAVDKDKGKNAQLHYSIDSGRHSQPFEDDFFSHIN